MNVMDVQKTTIFAAFCFSCSFTALAADWPTYRHDPQRSGVTRVELTFPLQEQKMLEVSSCDCCLVIQMLVTR